MSHWKSDNIDELNGFAKRMRLLVKERYYAIYPEENDGSPVGPSEITQILYTDYYDLVAPKGYPQKHSEFKKRNLAAIKKNVERHFKEVNPWKVSSGYMYAYSQIFQVSMDFLYGNTQYYTNNYDVKSICEKTKLSEKAVENLLTDDEVYICDFAFNDFVDAIEEDSEYEKVNEFWSKLIESDLYTKLPESYFRMACSNYFYKLCKQSEEETRTTKSTLPSKKKFLKLVETYEAYIPKGMTPAEVYDNDKEHALEIVRDIDHEIWYNISKDLKQLESIYWGCSGQFDRFVQSYFHKESDAYIVKLYKPQEEEQ